MLCIWLSVIWWCFGCILLCSDMLWMVIFLFVSDIVWFFGLSGGGCCGQYLFGEMFGCGGCGGGYDVEVVCVFWQVVVEFFDFYEY